MFSFINKCDIEFLYVCTCYRIFIVFLPIYPSMVSQVTIMLFFCVAEWTVQCTCVLTCVFVFVVHKQDFEVHNTYMTLYFHVAHNNILMSQRPSIRGHPRGIPFLSVLRFVDYFVRKDG